MHVHCICVLQCVRAVFFLCPLLSYLDIKVESVNKIFTEQFLMHMEYVTKNMLHHKFSGFLYLRGWRSPILSNLQNLNLPDAYLWKSNTYKPWQYIKENITYAVQYSNYACKPITWNVFSLWWLSGAAYAVNYWLMRFKRTAKGKVRPRTGHEGPDGE